MLIIVLYSATTFCQKTNIKLKFKIFDGRVSFDGKTLSKKYVLAYEKRPNKPYTGEYVVYYDKGIKSKQIYFNGKLNGLQSEWYKNGVKRKDSYYKDGQSVAPFKSWHKNGQKWEERYFASDTLFYKQWTNTGKKFALNYSVNGVKE